ncbi:SPT3 Dosage dependent suppressor of Ty-induced promoter mutations-like protein [Coemansia thaxteri]|uniref:SPT3 Dosage dependent suppressor of Ty-induced promoter mutations-like protein n=1 Tax=Coemansia thaxteri TaxID=2663907 RepID=A0A9W8EJR1_9FUNG|nr:SPT3 Dosage dependent suppressor of Ty-induced promoter mutations-like protein [Coemansia thaxteri]KAJ2475913.1 SPT3 Dosage dependent suppressor of Ty-induced promoter mutations-like protein [Coemansia sp. RSA 2320]
MASSANGGRTSNANINDYLRAADQDSSSGYAGGSMGAGQLPMDLSALLMSAGAATKSTPGSPATFSGALGFHSVRTSPALGPSQSPGLFMGGGVHPMFNLDSAVNSAVQSATASPIVGAFNRRGLHTSMANLNLVPLPPTAMGYMDANGMFGNTTMPLSAGGSGGSSAFMPQGSGNATAQTQFHSQDQHTRNVAARTQQMQVLRNMYENPAASAEFTRRAEQFKARGLRLELEGIPLENAKSRVETQIKITLRLQTEDSGEAVTCWTHLALPELLVSREKFRHRVQQQKAGAGAGAGEFGALPASAQHVVHLEASVICSSDPTRKVETCLGCIRREYKRSLRRKDAARVRSGAGSTCTTPAASRAASPVPGEGAGRMTGSMEADWDEQRLAAERQRIIIFNCSDLLDFSKGEVVLPARVTCYCRHHDEKEGFHVCLRLRDAAGAVLASHLSAPIMITDDHKSTKFKTERRTTRGRGDYERAAGDGSAAYASHALGPSHLHVIDGSLAGFKGGRQAMSARNSPTLRPLAHHGLLDTYSQFASLAGTPSLGNTPLGSPLLSAAAAAAAAAAHMGGFDTSSAHMGGFDTSLGGFDAPAFHLPQAAMASMASMAAAAMASSGGYPHPVAAPAMASSGGYHPTTAASLFPTPIQISHVAPAQGPVAGGVSVEISGRGFHGGVAVFFGSVQAARVQVVSGSSLVCVLPPTKLSGAAAVRVSEAGEGLSDTRDLIGTAVFTYVEDTDVAMLELSLQAMGLRGGGGESPDRGDRLGARILQDAAARAALEQLSGASKARRLLEIEAGLVALLGMLLARGLLDAARLSMRHTATGRSLLHFAALLGMLNLLSFLTAHGAALDEPDNNGLAPMHFACMFGRADIVELLLAAGASPAVRSLWGATPADMARLLGHAQIHALIEDCEGCLGFIRDDAAAVSQPPPPQPLVSDLFGSSGLFTPQPPPPPPHQPPHHY